MSTADLADGVTRGVPGYLRRFPVLFRNDCGSRQENGRYEDWPPPRSERFRVDRLPQAGFRPMSARNDIAIEFHGHAILLHAQFFHKTGKGERIVGLILTVDGELHRELIVARNSGAGQESDPGASVPLVRRCSGRFYLKKTCHTELHKDCHPELSEGPQSLPANRPS